MDLLVPVDPFVVTGGLSVGIIEAERTNGIPEAQVIGVKEIIPPAELVQTWFDGKLGSFLRQSKQIVLATRDFFQVTEIIAHTLQPELVAAIAMGIDHFVDIQGAGETGSRSIQVRTGES